MQNCCHSCGCQNQGYDRYKYLSEYAYEQSQAQGQLQAQDQFQAQGQAQDQDQYLRTIIRDIGNSNVNITVDNENILVAVLVLVEVLLGGALDTSALQTYLERRNNSKN